MLSPLMKVAGTNLGKGKRAEEYLLTIKVEIPYTVSKQKD